MADILSQAEIDELLNALIAGDNNTETAAPEPRPQSSGLDVKVYDFKTANKFQKEQLRTLNIVFQTFGQLFANKLTGILRTHCDCQVLSVEEQSFNEFNNSLPIPVVLAMLRISPMHGSTLMSISPELVYTIISRLMGGDTAGGDSNKQFTEIELALIEHVVKQSLPIFTAAWQKVCEVNTQLEVLETSAQFTQIVALTEAVAIITLNLTIGEGTGLISICIPYTSIEPMLGQLNTLLLFSSTQDGREVERFPERIRQRLINTPVSLTAYFEDTPATVSDIVNLQVGDVIRLDQQIQQPIMVKIQHLPKFYANIGTSGSRYAVRVVDIIKGENQDEL